MALPFSMVRYSLLSAPDTTLFLPADSFTELMAYLNGETPSPSLLTHPSLRRFLPHINALIKTSVLLKIGYKDVSRYTNLYCLIDYFIIRFCELSMQPLIKESSGEERVEILRHYSVLSETADMLENPAITEAVKSDLRSRESERK